MPKSIVVLKHLWVTEIYIRITIVRTTQHPGLVLGPRLEVGRCSTHYHLTCSVACVVDVVQSVVLVIDGTACTQCGIKFVLRLSCGENLPKPLIIGSVSRRYAIDWMIAPCVIVIKLLQIKHLKVARLLVVERHWVAHPTDGRLPIGSIATLFCRSEIFRCCRPILFRVTCKIVVTACRHCKCSNHYSG